MFLKLYPSVTNKTHYNILNKSSSSTTTTTGRHKSPALTFIVDLHLNLGHPAAHNHHLVELFLGQGAQHVAPLSGRQSNELLYGLHWPPLADKMPGQG